MVAQQFADDRLANIPMVPVKTARLIARLNGEQLTILEPVLRHAPDGKSIGEARTFDPVAVWEQAERRIEHIYNDNAKTYAQLRKESRRIRDEMVRAGTAQHVAQVYTAMLTEYARTFSERYGLDSVMELRRISAERAKPGDGGSYFHPLNPDVNLDTPMRTVVTERAISGEEVQAIRDGGKVRQDFQRAASGTLEATIQRNGKLENWKVSLPVRSVKHSVNTAMNDSRIDPRVSFGAIANAKGLFRDAILVESGTDLKVDTKQTRKPDMVHRLFSVLGDASGDYAVRFLVFEYGKGKKEAHIEGIDRFKARDVAVEKKMPESLRRGLAPVDAQGLAADSGHGYILRQVLEGVKDSQGNAYLQPAHPIDTPAFKNWFGDSKYINEDGSPRRFYHGGGDAILSFERGANRGSMKNYFSDSRDVGLKYAILGGLDHSLATVRDYAEHRAYKRRFGNPEEKEAVSKHKPALTEVYLKSKKPLDADNLSWREVREVLGDEHIARSDNYRDHVTEGFKGTEKDFVDSMEHGERGRSFRETWEYAAGEDVVSMRETSSAFRALHLSGDIETFMVKAGYDSVFYKDSEAGGVTVSVLSPEQIKSVHNRGTFNPGDPRIHHQHGARGAVELTPERAVIRLFETADLSTIPHESAHIFLDSLMRVVADDGGNAMALFESRMAEGMDLASAQKAYNRHLAGVEQARADLRTLREFAETQRRHLPKVEEGAYWESVPLEGDLTSAQLKTLHEVTATAFENYLMKGKAPSRKHPRLFNSKRRGMNLDEAANINGEGPAYIKSGDRVFYTHTDVKKYLQARRMKTIDQP